MEKMMLKISTEERQALQEAAKKDMRDMWDEARFLIRQELERRGYLAINTRNNIEGLHDEQN